MLWNMSVHKIANLVSGSILPKNSKWKFTKLVTILLIVIFVIPIITKNAHAGDISTSVQNGNGEFIYDGTVFVPRGVNYDMVGYNNSGVPDTYHGTFDPCTGNRTYPQCYGNGSQAEANLRYIHGSSSGSVFSYNYVRVFIASIYLNQGFTYTAGSGFAPTNTISGQWLSNLADFLQRAHNNGLRVILTGEYPPYNFPHGSLTCMNGNQVINPCSTGENEIIFNPQVASALGSFYSEILSNLNSSAYLANWPNAISAIMSFDIKNEAKVRSDFMPLSNQSLTNLQIDNSTYSMASFASRQALIDDLTKNFVITVGQAIRSSDPTHSILISASVTTPFATGKTGYNGANGPTQPCLASTPNPCVFPLRSDIMALYGKVDYRDIHSYPFPSSATGYNEAQDWTSAGLSEGSMNPVPLIMGEFGALRQSPPDGNPKGVYSSESTAIQALQQHMVDSCNYGFRGWGLWTWMPTDPTSTTQYYTAIYYNSDGSENNEVNGALAIQAWPVVCN